MNGATGLLFGVAIAALAGALIPVQAGANGALARGFDAPLLATFWSLFTSTVLVGIVLLCLRPALPSPALLERLPAWAWIGGLLGAIFVATATIFAPRLGAAAFTVAVVAGQTMASLALDSTGAFGYVQRMPTPGRLIGIALVVAGGLLVVLSTPASGASADLAHEARG